MKKVFLFLTITTLFLIGCEENEGGVPMPKLISTIGGSEDYNYVCNENGDLIHKGSYDYWSGNYNSIEYLYDVQGRLIREVSNSGYSYIEITNYSYSGNIINVTFEEYVNGESQLEDYKYEYLLDNYGNLIQRLAYVYENEMYKLVAKNELKWVAGNLISEQYFVLDNNLKSTNVNIEGNDFPLNFKNIESNDLVDYRHINYAYDNHLNPFSLMGDFSFFTSKNNLVSKEESYMGSNEIDVDEYTYTYNEYSLPQRKVQVPEGSNEVNFIYDIDQD